MGASYMKLSTMRGPSFDNIRCVVKKKKGQLGFRDEYLRVLLLKDHGV